MKNPKKRQKKATSYFWPLELKETKTIKDGEREQKESQEGGLSEQE
jgi:hypothetical protein